MQHYFDFSDINGRPAVIIGGIALFLFAGGGAWFFQKPGEAEHLERVRSNAEVDAASTVCPRFFAMSFIERASSTMTWCKDFPQYATPEAAPEKTAENERASQDFDQLLSETAR